MLKLIWSKLGLNLENVCEESEQKIPSEIEKHAADTARLWHIRSASLVTAKFMVKFAGGIRNDKCQNSAKGRD